MNAKNKLFHIILVLYYDAHREKPGQYNTYIKELLAEISTANDSKTPADEINDIRALKNLAGWLLKSNGGNINRAAVIAKLKFFVKDETIVSAFEEVMIDIEDKGQLDFTINDNIRDLKDLIHYDDVHEAARDAFFEITRGGLTGYKEALSNYAEKIKLLNEKGFSTDNKNYSYVVDSNKEGGIAELLEASANESSSEGRLKCGWKDMNRSAGGEKSPGFARGDLVLFGANQHNNKSGMAYALFKDILMSNTPYMLDAAKKPLMLFFSTEDNASKAMSWWFKHLYEQTHNEMVEMCDWSYTQREAFIREHFVATGYEFRYHRIKNSSDYTIFDLFNTLDGYERDGYEIHAVFFDYFHTINKKGLGTGIAGTDVKELFRRIRNYCNPRLITVFAPHQLNSESRAKLRDVLKEEDFVKLLPYRGFLEGGKGIDAELDVEFYQHVCVIKDAETGKKRYFLAIQRGKRRAADASRNELTYFLLEFFPVGGLLPDLNNEGDHITLESLDQFTNSGEGEW